MTGLVMGSTQKFILIAAAWEVRIRVAEKAQVVSEDLVVDDATYNDSLPYSQTQRSSPGSFLRIQQLGAPGKLKEEMSEAPV